MAKKKRTALPRVTVLAMSRRDLAAFVGAVEQLAQLVADLGALVPHLRGVGKPKKLPAAAAAFNVDGSPKQPSPASGG